MKKQKKQLLILLIVLIVLIGGYFGLTIYNDNQAVEVEQTKTEYIINVPADDMVRLWYSYEGKEYAFVNDDGTWKYEDNTVVSLDQNVLKTMRSYAARVNIKQKIEDVTDLSEYGLDEPQKYISFETEDQTYTIYVGLQNEYSLDYYIRLEGDDTVYVVQKTLVTIFNKTLEDLIQ